MSKLLLQVFTHFSLLLYQAMLEAMRIGQAHFIDFNLMATTYE